MTRYHQTTTTQAQQAPIPRPRSPLIENLMGALIIGAAVAIVVLLLALIVVLIVNNGAPPWAAIRNTFLAALVAGILIAAALAASWSWITITRPWIVDHKERTRRQRIDDQERERRHAMEDQLTHPPQPDPPVRLDRIPLVALAILQRAIAGQRTTRAVCVKVGICDQAEWNAANAVFKQLGWKRGYTLTIDPDLNVLWPEWNRRVYLANNRLWVLDQDGKNPHPIE